MMESMEFKRNNGESFEQVMRKLGLWAERVKLAEAEYEKRNGLKKRSGESRRQAKFFFGSYRQELVLLCRDLDSIVQRGKVEPVDLVKKLEQWRKQAKLKTLNGVDPLSMWINKNRV